MSNHSLLEKLELNDERSLLIQGLPSSIEKLFAKLSYAKNVTPLLKSRKVNFVLVFAVNQQQLKNLLKEVMSVVHNDSKLWIAFPKQTSKIVSDLNRETSWKVVTNQQYENVDMISLDHVWNAILFKKNLALELVVPEEEPVEIVEEKTLPVYNLRSGKSANDNHSIATPKLMEHPSELEMVFTKHKRIKEFFFSLPVRNQNEFVNWVSNAKKSETRQRRSELILEKLKAGKKTLSEK